jgi:hypothetical protein
MSLDRSTKLGRYEIPEPIGAGGMGEAYKGSIRICTVVSPDGKRFAVVL